MEVSSLRDRRLVALFATVVIAGAGATAAVVGLEHRAGYRSSAATDARFAPGAPEVPAPPGATEPAAVIVAVVGDPTPQPTPTAGVPTNGVPGPTDDGCSTASPAPHGRKSHDDCPKPTKPTKPAPPVPVKVEKADAGPAHGVVIASETEPKGKPGPIPASPPSDDTPKPGPTPKPSPAPKPGPKGKSVP